MSCANRFTCGIRKYDQHKITTHTVTNQTLHHESEKRLEDMMKERALQDQGIFSPTMTSLSMTTPSTLSTPWTKP